MRIRLIQTSEFVRKQMLNLMHTNEWWHLCLSKHACGFKRMNVRMWTHLSEQRTSINSFNVVYIENEICSFVARSVNKYVFEFLWIENWDVRRHIGLSAKSSINFRYSCRLEGSKKSLLRKELTSNCVWYSEALFKLFTEHTRFYSNMH